jgi:hypothetical protein
MKSINLLLLLIPFVFIASCSKSPNSNDEDSKGSVLIFNQGGFNKGEASVSVYDVDTEVVTHNAFLTRNNRPLGDVFQSASEIGVHLYLVINNSKKIEVVDPATLASIRTLNLPSHISPRYLAAISATEGYVSSLFTNYVYRLNLITGAISDSVDVGAGSEGIIYANNRIFVARNLNSDFSTAHGITVIVANSGLVEKTIPTLPGPSIMLLNNNDLWVNATGEWGMNNGGLIRVNTLTRELVENIEMNASTNGLAYSRVDNSLIVLSNGIVKYSINNRTQNKISNRNYYGIKVYEKDEIIIYAADAKNYSDNGVIRWINTNGTVVDSITAGIVPFGFHFR